MKALTIIEVLLTFLVFLSFVAAAHLGTLEFEAHHGGAANAQLIHVMENPVLNMISVIVFFSWLILTPFYLLILFIYLGSYIFSKLTDEDVCKI